MIRSAGCRGGALLAASAVLFLLPRTTAGQERAAELRNASQVVENLLLSNAGRLLEHGFAARAEISVAVDARGKVTGYGLSRPTGNRIMDGALVAVARQMVFTPASEKGRPVPSRVSIPVVLGDAPRSGNELTITPAPVSQPAPQR